MSATRITGPEAVQTVAIAIAKAKSIDDVPCHPVAAIFPLIDGDEWDSFKADVATQGLLNPIVVDHFGQIIDGRNRAKAIIELGAKAPSARIVTLDFGGDDERVITHIISANLARRQLTISQRIAIAAGLANLAHGGARRSEQGADLNLEPGADRVADLQPEPMTIAKAAETMQVSESAVKKYKAAKVTEANPQAHAAVKAGKKSAEAAIKETKANAVKKPAAATVMPKPIKVRGLDPPECWVRLDDLLATIKPHLAALESEGKKNMARMSTGSVAYHTHLICKALAAMSVEGEAEFQRMLDQCNAIAAKHKAVIAAYKGVFTRTEYKSLLGMLHTDRLHGLDDEQRAKYERMFNLVKSKELALCGDDEPTGPSTLPKTVADLMARRAMKREARV